MTERQVPVGYSVFGLAGLPEVAPGTDLAACETATSSW